MSDDVPLTLRIGGRDDAAVPSAPTPAPAFGLTTRVKRNIRVETLRGDATPAEITAQPDDVIELTMEDGARLFLRADEAALRLRGAGQRSATQPGVIELQTRLTLDMPGLRGGVADWAIRQLRTLGVDLPDGGAAYVGGRADAHLVPNPGLFQWAADQSMRSAGALNATGPLLVFLHGTVSSASGSFGALSTNAVTWAALQRRYPDRVLALQHHTLLRSPVGNALDLMQALPAGATLHLVSHSRGGLIGDLLCRSQRQQAAGQGSAPFDAVDQGVLAAPEYQQQREDLAALDALLREKRPVIQRFVRVACPARGTILASDRLDHWLTMLLNVLGLAVGAAGVPALGPAYDAVEAFLLAVVKERTDPRTIPGLEAMIPGSPLIKMLNRPDVRSDADLSVVEGDTQPSGVLRRLGIWFVDLFYGESNDLVVNTSSMQGGVGRAGSRWFFDRSAQVDHFSYFKNPITAERVLAGLARADADLAGFHDTAVEPGPTLWTRSSRGLSSKPIVYVLPDFLGSALADSAGRVWIDPVALAAGGLCRLAMGQPGVTAPALIDLYYNPLCTSLDATHEVRPFPYDGRLPIDTIGALFAAELGAALDQTMDQGARPVRIVAHGMGGLVARAAFLDATLWARFRDRDTSRLVELSTPCGGTWAAPMLLLGRSRLARALSAADLKNDPATLAGLFAEFPSVLALLPADPSTDFFDPATWSRLADPGVPTPDASLLARARALRSRLASSSSAVASASAADARCMSYIAGQGPTVNGVTVDPGARAGERLVFSRTLEGDGQVLWRTGVPTGLVPWYAAVRHGDLVRDKAVMAAIEDLLRSGTTDKLARDPRGLLAGRTAPDPIFRDAMTLQPGASDLADAALVGDPAPIPAEPPPKTRIRVVHGHLAFASYPMMIGHYTGDAIVGAEKQLEKALEPLLTDRIQLGLYAGPIDSTTIVLDHTARPPGAVVVGLGDAGSLSVGALQRTLRTGLLAYAAAEGDRQRARNAPNFRNQPAEMAPMSLSTLLIGSGVIGLERSDCIQALLRAVARARSVLALCKGAKPMLAEIEIVEIIEDGALDTWHGLARLLAPGTPFSEVFELTGSVERRPGARRRLCGGWDRDWWQPIQITMPDLPGSEPVLVFSVAGGLARAETRVIAADLDLVQSLMKSAITPDAGVKVTAPGRTLFELLMPLALKEQSRDDRNRRLLLDEKSARFPWELLDDRRPWSSDGTMPDESGRRPQAVRSGLLRQLLQTKFREQVVVPYGHRKALVIGDPRGSPADGFPELKAAQDEAQAVVRMLGTTHDVTALIGAAVMPEQVIEALFSQAWDIVHIAGHGVVQHKLPGPDGALRSVTGVVLGQGFVLGPSTLAKLPVSPSLVFVNCCHLGRVDPDAEQAARLASVGGNRPELAASVAVELIRAGVNAVIAAGWAVDDDAASVFARVFYTEMNAGGSLGAASHAAREAAYDRQPTGNTWGAYQCYGEPDFRLPGHLRGAGATLAAGKLGSRAEAIAAAERIREDLNIKLERNLPQQRGRLRALQQQIVQQNWLEDGEMRVALAEAWGELGDYEAAIEHYQAARTGTDSRVKIRAIEQLANLQARHALIGYRARPEAQRDDSGTARTVVAALELVEALATALGPTAERWALQGSAWKRLAQILPDPVLCLQPMADAYGQARNLGGLGKFYPVLQHCAAHVILNRLGIRPVTDVTTALQDIAGGAAADQSDFWARIGALDARILLAVDAGSITRNDEANFLRDYRAVWNQLGSALKLRSVTEHFEFLEDALGAGNLAAALGRIRTALEASIRDMPV